MQRARHFWPWNKTTDIWHVGIARAPIARFLTPLDKFPPIDWMPLLRPFSFIADPFAIPDANGGLTILAEMLDYRVKRGEIHYYRLDANHQIYDSGCALRLPSHLSYPYLISHSGETYMLPENHRSGKLTLYRATDFPRAWEPVATLLDVPAIDASPIEFEGKWWMFFTLPGPHDRALNELHIAYADNLLGPWTMHAGNPVRTGLEASRIGGTPFIHEGALHLPMQDCRTTYGGGINLLNVTALTPETFSASIASSLTADTFHPVFRDGMHTLSTCGDVTLLDVKRISRSPQRRLIDLQRRLSRLVRPQRYITP